MLDVTLYKNNSDALKKDFLLFLEEHLVNVGLPMQIINAIMDSSFIDSNPIYYTYYPYLFSDKFKVENKNLLKKLNIAGFLYYKSILTIDSIFDNKEAKNFDHYIIANFCQEESIKILAEIFISKPMFWKYWNLRKTEYSKAYKLDKTTQSIQNLQEYELLADFKCAFGKIAIDSLFVLTNCQNEDSYNRLLQSHKYYYTAFQILDDLKDIEEDLKNDQFNIAFYCLGNKLPEQNIRNYDSKTIRTKLYTEGVALDLYEKAFHYIQKSKLEVNGISGINQWLFEIQSLNNSIVKGGLNIEGFIKVFNINSSLSKNFTIENHVDKAIINSRMFLEKYQCEDGYWRDYFNHAGNSDEWATGFVLSTCSELISESNSQKAINNLQSNILNRKLWGYNSKWISDADSTTFVLLSLIKNNVELPKHSISEWFKYQNPDGGFRTYLVEEEVLISLQSKHISNANGWMKSHFCVSATAYYFLSYSKLFNESYNNLRDYIIKGLKNFTRDLCYWWTNSIYALYYIYKGAIETSDKEMATLAEYCIEQSIDKEEDNTFHTNKFYQGLLLEMLCNSNTLFEKHQNIIALKVQQLIHHQYDDGSWEANGSMRIPHPEMVKNDINSQNWPCKDTGTNIIVKDFHRIFTTAICSSALLSYRAVVKEVNNSISYNF
jgi:hypothetical protein